MRISKGIFDSPTKHTVKITKVSKRKTGIYAEMHFTNNPSYGKYAFGLEGKGLQSFMKTYKKRKK